MCIATALGIPLYNVAGRLTSRRGPASILIAGMVAYGCSGRARTCASIPSIGGGIADRFGYPSVGLFAEMALALAFVLHLRRLEREAATAHVTKSGAGSSKVSWEWSLLLGRKARRRWLLEALVS
jgi:hypothetical protein